MSNFEVWQVKKDVPEVNRNQVARDAICEKRTRHLQQQELKSEETKTQRIMAAEEARDLAIYGLSGHRFFLRHRKISASGPPFPTLFFF